MKIVYANTVSGGSVGTVIQQLRSGMERDGHSTLLLYGRGPFTHSIDDIRIGSTAGTLIHGVKTRLADAHGLASYAATLRFIELLERNRPDLVHLHNIHGYWLHYPLLFKHLTRLQKSYGLGVVWTLHDSWPLTGGCALPDAANCRAWIDGCNEVSCPGKNIYPRAIVRRLERNIQLKHTAFTSPQRMVIITPSEFMNRRMGESFLSKYPRHTIRNTLNSEFRNPHRSENITRSESTVLAVAWPWYAEKGWADLIPLRKLLPPEVELRVVGLTAMQRRRLPDTITKLPKLYPAELCDEYARATVLVNLSRAETLPTVCLEAQAMGCPVVSYDIGGASEAIDPESGVLIPPAPCALHDPNPALPHLAKAVMTTITSPRHPDTAFIAPFLSSTAFIEKHLAIYRSLLPHHSTSPHQNHSGIST